MKEFWFWLENGDNKLITTALESGASAIVTQDEKKAEEVKKLGRIKVLKPGKDVVYIKIESKEDEEKAYSRNHGLDRNSP